MKNGEVITIYLPIFEEKLAKLEARGLGDTVLMCQMGLPQREVYADRCAAGRAPTTLLRAGVHTCTQDHE